MKTYKITIELRVDSTNESIDDILTEVGRALKFAHYYKDAVDNIDTALILNVEVCECAYCDNRDKEEVKKRRRVGKEFRFLPFKASR